MAHTYHLTVDPQDGGCRLDSYLYRALLGAQALPSGVASAEALSRARIKGLIVQGDVRVMGRPKKPSYKVRAQEAVEVLVPKPQAMALVPVPMPLDILYEDAHLLVVNKPAHLVVHPGAGQHGPTLVEGLLAHAHDLSGIGGVLRPGIVHRLDRGTTGLMVVAKTDASHRHLSGQFAARTVKKGYLALVWRKASQPARGLVATGGEACTAAMGKSGLIDTPFGRSPSHRKRMTGRLPETLHGRRAKTRWQLLAHNEQLALLAVTLLTGRTHQIRVHLCEMGWPIVADHLYGRGHRSLPHGCEGLDHQALHAAYLAFDHPITAQRLTYRAPLPQSWQRAAAQLYASETSTTTGSRTCLV